MNPADRQLAKVISGQLESFARTTRSLPGISSPGTQEVLAYQIVESIRRVKYISAIRTSDVASSRRDPESESFDPLKAAILYQRAGKAEEAFWLVFLSVHFGKHGRGGWRLCRNVYGSLGGKPWTWARVSTNPAEFRRWLGDHITQLRSDPLSKFGNHRKYISLNARSSNGTGAAVETYVNWISRHGTHEQLIERTSQEAKGDAHKAFDLLFQSMAAVAMFGRTARFDYLTMLGKMGLAPIEPGSPYLDGATGPYEGARLLFGGSKKTKLTRKQLSDWLIELGAQIGQGMQVLEDALCNWQKSPKRFIRFRG